MPAVILLGPAERSQIAATLNLIAESSRPCASCKRMIWFCRTKNGRLMPVDDDGVSHFATCNDPERFRRPR